MVSISRRMALLATVAIAGFAVTSAMAEGLPPLKQKATYKVGFAQTESNNPWRLAQTASMKDEAAKLGWQLVYTDAAGSAAKQVADVNSMIAQGVDAIFLSPREEKPLIPAVIAAKKAGIPLFLIDRSVDPNLAKAGVDYVTFIGSDFILEGKTIAEYLAKKTDGKGNILEIEGSTGASAATDRKTGFDETIAKFPGLKIVASQSGNFNRDEGRKTAEALLQAHPEANIIFAHNDEMAIGAISAIEAAGKKPGKDILIFSIDGEKDGLQAIIDGKMVATVECNPKFGPAAFAAAIKYSKGEAIPAVMTNKDRFYDSSNAAASMADSY
jgi:galactofuranose transport system substrate-binding protein